MKIKKLKRYSINILNKTYNIMETIIRIDCFGFDGRMIHTILYHNEKINLLELDLKFSKLYFIYLNEGDKFTVHYLELNRYTDKYILFLKSKGFKELKYDYIRYFCD